MIIDCISDLHGFYPKLDGGDLLIVAGDLTARDEPEQYEEFFEWLKNQSYRKKVFISGNHDNLSMSQFDWFDAEYLSDTGTEFDGLKIWGSPWTKTFPGINPDCCAFTKDTEEEIADKFELIPHDTDILITHSPAYGILDKVKRFNYPKTKTKFGDFLNIQCDHAGSLYLHNWFKYCGRPALHVSGHIHESYGQAEVWSGKNDTMVKSINASHVNENYEPVNPPIRIEL